jgi:NAD+ synthase (glutamine-hydrolysing)
LDSNGLGGITVVIGHPKFTKSKSSPWAIAENSASVIKDGKVLSSYSKHHLPNYSVFDEFRNFVPGDRPLKFECEGVSFGVLICEDIWQSGGPVADLIKLEPEVILVLNGSPFEIDKLGHRIELSKALAIQSKAPIAYVNLVGGQDDLVFDGASFAVNSNGELAVLGKQFSEDLLLLDLSASGEIKAAGKSESQLDGLEQIWQALVLSLRDYVEKNNFKSVILGLSGGIDSAVCAALAVDAVGPERVFGVSLPSQYSSDHSKSDAADLAERLEIKLSVQPIEPTFQVVESQLNLDGVAAENLQARIRALILMGLSNQEGHLVLTTGNKTELAVGYSTIYGDSVGGFAPLKDVDKVMVWSLARWRNAHALSQNKVAPIPQNSIDKPPSAELRPGQTDQDTLPEYEVLCEILDRYVEQRLSIAQITAEGFDSSLVERVANLVNTAEWKRRQGAIGPKITGMSFGRERRMPITNKYR